MWELIYFIQLFREAVTDLQKTEYELELQRQDIAAGMNKTVNNVRLKSLAYHVYLINNIDSFLRKCRRSLMRWVNKNKSL